MFKIPPGEHQGPLTVRRSCTVEGADATLWAASGPVLTIEAPRVTVRNLRIEPVGSRAQGMPAIAVRAQDARLEQVEAAGAVTGLAGESEDWSLPRLIDLGSFAAEEDNSFIIELWAPQEAVLENLMTGVGIGPLRLQTGMNRLTLHTGEMGDNIILYGEILVRTAQVIRRIYIKGEAEKNAPLRRDAAPKCLEPRPVVPRTAGKAAGQAQAGGARIDTTRPPQQRIDTTRPPQRKIDTTRPPRQRESGNHTGDVQGTPLVRGQRITLSEKRLVLKYQDAGRPAGVDLNCVVFCLNQQSRAEGDEALVFFNQPESPDGAVKVSQTGGLPQVELDLARAAEKISRYVISFALYEPPQGVTLGSLREPGLIVTAAGGQVLYHLPLSGLGRELVVNALEIYRYKNEWKLSFVGAGYEAGLDRLCRDYGIEVE